MSPSPFDCWLFEDNEWAALCLLWKCLPPWQGQRAKCMKVLPLLSFGFKFDWQKSHKKAELMTEIVCTQIVCCYIVCGNVWDMILAFSWRISNTGLIELTKRAVKIVEFYDRVHPAFADPDLSVMITQLFPNLEQYCVVRGCETEGGLSWMIWVPYQVALQHIHSQIQISKSSAQAQARLKM